MDIDEFHEARSLSKKVILVNIVLLVLAALFIVLMITGYFVADWGDPDDKDYSEPSGTGLCLVSSVSGMIMAIFCVLCGGASLFIVREVLEHRPRIIALSIINIILGAITGGLGFLGLDLTI